MAKILVIDDQESILKSVEAILKKSKYEVFTAADGYIALDKISLINFDLIITDAMMPGISGYDLIKSVRLSERTRSLPIIMLTSRQERRDVEKAIQVQVDDYVIKPLDPDLLTAKVAGLLARAGVPPKPAEASVLEEAEVRVFVKVTGVSEAGVTLASPQNLGVGSIIPINTPLFKRIGIAVPQVTRVISSQAHGDGYVVLTQYMELKTEELEVLRAWIARQIAKAA